MQISNTLRPRLLALSALALMPLGAHAQGGPGGGPGPLLPPPAPPANPITPAKAVLGKMLFWEEQISPDNTISCGTCHIPSSGGSDPRSGASTVNPGLDGIFGSPDDIIGSSGVIRSDAAEEFSPDPNFSLGAQVTGRYTPSFIAAAYFPELFWDGRAGPAFFDPETGALSIPFGAALENQAVGPLLSDVEMAHEGLTWGDVTGKLAVIEPMKLASTLTPDIVSALALMPTYPEAFQAAFGTPDITAERIAFAIATYERTLVPDQTPWDNAQRGIPGSFTPAEQRGLNVFLGRNCQLCHAGSLFSNGSFRNIGVRPIFEDRGRQVVTSAPQDAGRFKVPTLRGAGERTRFFHNGGMANLGQVVDFYARGGDFQANQDPAINPFPLPPGARADLIAFLSTGLTDPRVAAELPPFDRPTLSTETPIQVPQLIGGEVAGSGGFVPQMIAVSPPSVGTPGFRLGVASARGGARALLVFGAVPSSPASGSFASVMAITPVLRSPLRLEGSGPGTGYGTWKINLPNKSSVIGGTYRAQWYVRDPAAPGKYARSEVVELTAF